MAAARGTGARGRRATGPAALETSSPGGHFGRGRCGRQGEALEAYRYARRTLVEQIGVEPGPELRRLHEAILRQDASLDVVPIVAELPRELDEATAPPLIGRDGELRRLRERWRRAAEGAGALVTLVAAYGMGKTRLAAALAAQAHGEDATVLYATGTGGRAPERLRARTRAHAPRSRWRRSPRSAARVTRVDTSAHPLPVRNGVGRCRGRRARA